MPDPDSQNCGSAADLVAQFKAAQAQLLDIVDEYESDRFRSIEERMSNLFSSIGRHEPVDKGEFSTLAQFYLDQMELDEGGYNKRLHDRLRHLIVRHAADPCLGSPVTVPESV